MHDIFSLGLRAVCHKTKKATVTIIKDCYCFFIQLYNIFALGLREMRYQTKKAKVMHMCVHSIWEEQRRACD